MPKKLISLLFLLIGLSFSAQGKNAVINVGGETVENSDVKKIIIKEVPIIDGKCVDINLVLKRRIEDISISIPKEDLPLFESPLSKDKYSATADFIEYSDRVLDKISTNFEFGFTQHEFGPCGRRGSTIMGEKVGGKTTLTIRSSKSSKLFDLGKKILVVHTRDKIKRIYGFYEVNIGIKDTTIKLIKSYKEYYSKEEIAEIKKQVTTAEKQVKSNLNKGNTNKEKILISNVTISIPKEDFLFFKNKWISTGLIEYNKENLDKISKNSKFMPTLGSAKIGEKTGEHTTITFKHGLSDPSKKILIVHMCDKEMSIYGFYEVNIGTKNMSIKQIKSYKEYYSKEKIAEIKKQMEELKEQANPKNILPKV